MNANVTAQLATDALIMAFHGKILKLRAPPNDTSICPIKTGQDQMPV
ncbi:hypothetical protein [Rhizobium leguminosarum]|nr:hypothetical protein [Rhizobium leguminosarum]MBY3026878.1 hypothetical protein [Rhizobium leguminosarum]